VRALARSDVRGLSLEVVAGLTGIGKQYLSMLELDQRGFNRRRLLEDLAAALGCSVADLTGSPICRWTGRPRPRCRRFPRSAWRCTTPLSTTSPTHGPGHYLR
jgi:transcriptional regulator with XRE-family HTH domain